MVVDVGVPRVQTCSHSGENSDSVPDDVFERATRVAKRLGVSRSELFTKAMREFLGAQRGANITASYDEAFAEDEEARVRKTAARRELLSVEWEGE